ncbi:hypothetical protein HO173_006295 [Letharia columbiana]|uniref:Uncharacterized protein n=1 Tax=Letharia columbiana TaxID=112416 RepID=A0A8H6FVR3_9LECA|nr:uncharacterized protein HO173_006295 [Letharia columbiana]KAF6235612.1 hypothetical protein HO173_006295 [Letharia columbiana]
MSQSRIPRPSQGSSRSYTPSLLPSNPTPVNSTGYHGNPVTRVCRVIFRNPDQGGYPTITVEGFDGTGDLPGQGPTMDLVDDSRKNEGRPWNILSSSVEMTFFPTGPGVFGYEWSRHPHN